MPIRQQLAITGISDWGAGSVPWPDKVGPGPWRWLYIYRRMRTLPDLASPTARATSYPRGRGR